MYKVYYQKIAILNDGSKGNISFGKDVAYVDCDFGDIKSLLEEYLLRRTVKNKEHPLINKVKYIKGHILK